MATMLGSVSSRGCLDAPMILPTTRGLRAHQDTHGWRLSLCAAPVPMKHWCTRVQQRALSNKVKNTLKRIICSCCFYLTHTFEVSSFEVLISRFFWAFFSNPPDLHVMGVGRSAAATMQLRLMHW